MHFIWGHDYNSLTIKKIMIDIEAKCKVTDVRLLKLGWQKHLIYIQKKNKLKNWHTDTSFWFMLQKSSLLAPLAALLLLKILLIQYFLFCFPRQLLWLSEQSAMFTLLQFSYWFIKLMKILFFFDSALRPWYIFRS